MTPSNIRPVATLLAALMVVSLWTPTLAAPSVAEGPAAIAQQLSA